MTDPQESTPIFDALVAEHEGLFDYPADDLMSDPEPWGLDEQAPRTLGELISEVKDRLDPDVALRIERVVAAEQAAKKLNLIMNNLAEKEVNGDDLYDEWGTDRPAGDAGVADRPEGPAVVDDGGTDGAGDPQAG